MSVSIIPFSSTLLLSCSLIWFSPCQQFFNLTTTSNPLTLPPFQCSSSPHVLIFIQTQFLIHHHLLFLVLCKHPHLLWSSFPIIPAEKTQPWLSQLPCQLLPHILIADSRGKKSSSAYWVFMATNPRWAAIYLEMPLHFCSHSLSHFARWMSYIRSHF